MTLEESRITEDDLAFMADLSLRRLLFFCVLGLAFGWAGWGRE